MSKLLPLGVLSLPPLLSLSLLIGLPVSAGAPSTEFSDGRGERFFALLDRRWQEDPSWLEGKAELNFYDATLIKYGEPRPQARIVHILVKEDHDPALLVKAEDWRRPGLIPMLKFITVIDIPTGIYAYRQMASIFFNRQDLHFAKMTFSSQEWCGITFKEIVHFQGRSHFHSHTYQEGEGGGSHRIDLPADPVLYDSLPLQLRMLRWRPGLQASLELLPSQISNRAPRPSIQEARLEVTGPETVEVPAGSYSAYRVRLQHGSGEDTLWFEEHFPHRLLRWETFEGHRQVLRASRKLAYWRLNKPGDEVHLPWPSTEAGP